jgi:Protein of unknown function (DUF4019)
MKNLRLSAVILTVLLAAVGFRSAFAQEANAAARASVESWLGLVDGQRYAESWQAAGAFFKNAVTEQKWQEAVQTARGPLGALKSRTVKGTTAAKTLPGAPDGDYLLLQFDTSFERKAAAVETVTMVREADGVWRVVGYFVR